MSRWHKTEFEGVRYREHPTRKFGAVRDRYFSIRYRVDGKRIEEALGWASKGMTAKNAALELARLQEAQRKGTGEPVTLREKREIAKAEREEREKEGVTFQEYFEDTFVPQAEIVKPKETRQKKGQFRDWINPVIGALPFSQIGVVELDRIRTNLLKAGKAPRTVEKIFSTIRRVWNDARSKEIISQDCPTKKIKLDRFDNKRCRYFTHKEADALLAELKIKHEPTYRQALISLHCGLRFGEIAALRWGDIDTRRKIIGIRNSKGGFSRHARMTEEVKALFTAMNQGEREDLIFPTAEGTKLTDPHKSFGKTVKELGFNKGVIDRRQRLSFHSLRHTYASWLVDRGVGLYDVQKLLGHKNSELTQRYSHLSDSKLTEDVKELERGIREARRKNKVVALRGNR
jgi:integrase